MATKLNCSTATWIALNADVRCSGMRFGRIVGVVLDPRTYQITHLSVKEKGLIGIERMVPAYFDYDRDRVQSLPPQGCLLVTRLEDLQYNPGINRLVQMLIAVDHCSAMLRQWQRKLDVGVHVMS